MHVAIPLLIALMSMPQMPQRGITPPQVPFLIRDSSSRVLYERILEAEDKRQLTKVLAGMLGATQAHVGVRRRAAAAVGRIGDVNGLELLLPLLDPELERSLPVRCEAAFAIGELEPSRQPGLGIALERLVAVLGQPATPQLLRGRVAEALGKILANPKAAGTVGEEMTARVVAAVAALLPAPGRPVAGDDLFAARLAVSALMRIRGRGALAALVPQLTCPVAALRADAANAIARLRPDPAAGVAAIPALEAQLRDVDPIARANAARALAAINATQTATAISVLLSDSDQRVVASAIRALGTLAQPSSGEPLLALGERLAAAVRQNPRKETHPSEHGLLMLVAEALGQLKQGLPFLQRIRALDGAVGANPETEIAVAAFGDAAFLDATASAGPGKEWHHVAAYAQGLGALGTPAARHTLRALLSGRDGPVDPRALGDILSALARIEKKEANDALLEALKHDDVIVRATAAGLLAESLGEPADEGLFAPLQDALSRSSGDRDPDARLALLEAIARYKRQRALDLLSGALSDANYIVRRRAAELLEAAGAGAFLQKAPPATQPPRPRGYYTRVEKMMRGGNPVVTISTEKGDIQVELLVRDAPLTVANFLDLARSGYFDGLAFHRVVPNFVVQGGDPRGDGNGGPGYQIRCEVNQVRYERGVVGMALSGKDTGGSQFFFTHSPQPHLDGGYTAFGRVAAGMEVVDRLSRGDRITRVVVP
jgi:cyclophilin family peptidyl-prolyl cis-trans isomerase/HEAT repeat protein